MSQQNSWRQRQVMWLQPPFFSMYSRQLGHFLTRTPATATSATSATSRRGKQAKLLKPSKPSQAHLQVKSPQMHSRLLIRQLRLSGLDDSRGRLPLVLADEAHHHVEAQVPKPNAQRLGAVHLRTGVSEGCKKPSSPEAASPLEFPAFDASILFNVSQRVSTMPSSEL